ncbi:MAG: hypothetical protein IPJ00_00125 [Saprospirales bacterium]|nr:hypothetical protein [Saprospirales bacterium]
MKRIPLLALCLVFLAPAGAWAQNEAPLVVMECQGQVKYSSPDRPKPVGVTPGRIVSREGTFKPKKGASGQLLNNTELVSVELKAKIKVQDAVPPAPSGGRFGFGGDFLSMVKETALATDAAMAPRTSTKGAGGDEPPPPPNTRKGAGGDEPPPPPSTRKGAGGDEPPPPPNTRKGAGEGLAMVNWNFPIKGKMFASGQIPFSWDGYFKEEGPWLFSISQAGSGEKVYETKTTDPFVSINTVQGKLSIGNSYVWRVQAADQPVEAMKAYEFSLVQENAEKGVLDVVAMEPEYEKAGPVQKLLWEAYAFEEAKFLSKADALYKEALRLDPANGLAVQLYRAFWARNW